MKLCEHDINMLRVIQRTKVADKADAEGWYKVSKIVMPMLTPAYFKAQELIELRIFPTGDGLVRLTQRGEIVSEYLI